MKKHIIFLLLLSLLWGCGSNDDVQGDVFIVTKGGESIKLGLVTVKVISEPDLRKHIADAIVVAKINIQTLNKEIKIINDSIGLLQSEYDRLESKIFSSDFNTPYSLSLAKKQSGVFNKLEQLKKKYSRLTNEYFSYSSAQHYLPDTSYIVTSVQSDPEGKFIIQVPTKGKYYLVASTKRTVGHFEEKYAWIIPIEDKNKRYFLSNTNLFEPNQKQDFVNTDELGYGDAIF